MMEGEPRSRKHDMGREKIGLNARKRCLHDRKARSESLHYSSASIPEDSPHSMMVVGKGCSFVKSKSYDSGHYLHECCSDTAMSTSFEKAHKDAKVPNEGIQIGLPAYPTVSNTSFSSAKSQMSNSDAIQKKVRDMDSELNSKNATIARLRKELGKEGDMTVECQSLAVETDFTFGVSDDYMSKLNELKKSVAEGENTISELTKKMEESTQARVLEVEKNLGLSHEVNLLNRQLQSMHELVHSKNWDTGVDPRELAKYKSKTTELEMSLSKQEERVRELNATLHTTQLSLKTKDQELKAKTQELVETKTKSGQELYKLISQIDCLEKDAKTRAQMQDRRMTEAEKKIEQEMIKAKAELEGRYQQELKAAVEKYRKGVEKVSSLPKNAVAKLLDLIDLDKADVLILQKEVEEQRSNFEKKIDSLREEHEREVKHLTEMHDSKLVILKAEVESLNQKLEERNSTVQTFESELLRFKSASSIELLKISSKSDDISSLRELYDAELVSQKQIHKLEMDVLEEKVKRLSQDILYHAKNEEMHLQELQNAKVTSNTFREKYEQLLSEWEERSMATACESGVVEQMEMEQVVEKLRSLTLALKEASRLHEEKVKHLQKLHEDEIAVCQREMDALKMKLDEVDRFQSRQTELDDEMRELVKNVEFKHTRVIVSLTHSHETELRLRQAEMNGMEKRYLEDIESLKQRHELELSELRSQLQNQQELQINNNAENILKLNRTIEDVTVQLITCQGLLASKEEIEEALNARLKELEDLLRFKEENCKKELEEIMSKHVRVQALLEAKEEIARELEDKIRESDKLLEKSKRETDELDKNCVKLKEKLAGLEDKCNVTQKRNETLESDYEAMVRKNEDLVCKYKEVLKINENLESNYKSTKMQKETLESNYKAALQRNENLEANCSAVEQSTANLMEVNNNLQTKLQCNTKLETQYGALLEQHEALAANHTAAVQQITILQSELDSAKKILDNRRNDDERNRIQERIRALEENENELNLRIEHLTAELANNKGPENEDVQEVELLFRASDGNQPESPRSEQPEVELIYRTASESTSTGVQAILPRVESTDTLRYIIRCSELEKEREELQKENESLRVELKEKDIEEEFTASELERVRSKNSFHEELVVKFRSIGEELSSMLSDKNRLLSMMKNLEEEAAALRAKVQELQLENSELRARHEADLRITDAALSVELAEKEEEITKLKLKVEQLRCCTEKLSRKAETAEELQAELRHCARHVATLKNELQEAWTQRCEVEDQLLDLRKENALLSLHRSQLEQSNKRISNLISEGTPSVVSWLQIHESVENIVEEVIALRTSFGELGPSSKVNSKSELRLLTESLHLQLENKNRMCDELLQQKTSLERDLQRLEERVRHNEGKIYQQRGRYESELRNQDLCFKKWRLEVRGNQSINLDQQQLEVLKQDSQETYCIALEKLKEKFEDQSHQRDILAQEIQKLNAEMARLQGEIKRKDEALKEKADPEKKEMDETEMESLRTKYETEMKELTREHEIELQKLRSILTEMQENGNNSLFIHEIEAKHKKEMEELRTYFEQKCADVEKHYSEEILSQQSRRMSSSSSVSESEFLTDMLCSESAIENTKRDIVIENYLHVLDQDGTVEEKKRKLENLLIEMMSSHAEEVSSLHSKYGKEMRNLEAKHTGEMNRINSELSEMRNKIEIEKREFENKIQTQLDEERKRFHNLMEDTEQKHKKELAILEESWAEEASRLRAESVFVKVQGGEKEVLLAEYYKGLTDNALSKFQQEQEELVKSQAEMMQKLILGHEKQMKDLKEQFTCEEAVRRLESEFRTREKELESELSSIKSTYEDELLELRKNCQDTLQEQVSLAKTDAFNSLQQQIQVYLEGDDTNSAPQEVIELGEKFAGKYRKEIEELKEKHQGEVSRIRDEYEGKVKRRYSTSSIQRRRSLDRMDNDRPDVAALEEMVSALRHVLSELIKYVGSCEEELNNTILVDFVRQEETLYKSIKLDHDETDLSMLSRRVHLAPDLSTIMNDSNLLNSTAQVREELDRCLRQLKNDATSLLVLSDPDRKRHEELYNLLTSCQKEKSNLEEKLKELEELQRTLQAEVVHTKEKLNEWERSREVVSEGFGEEVVQPEKSATLTQLKDKAKLIITEQSSQPANVMTILEEICKEGDRLQEEARREKSDLQQQGHTKSDTVRGLQVLAADKQLRSIRQFLEEQATERELERDEYLREVTKLQDALRVRERDGSLQDRMSLEGGQGCIRLQCVHPSELEEQVDNLETHLKDVTARLSEAEEGKTNAEKELKAAVDKIWTLREIISELEGQIVVANQCGLELEKKVEKMQQIIEEQSKSNKEMALELENLKSGQHAELMEHCRRQEAELTSLRLLAEQTSPEALSQLKANLRDVELLLVKKTKDLEQLHTSSAAVSCSSPSEDVSIREHMDATRCPTPDEMRNAEPCLAGLPFEEVDRINEKLFRHNRAEEVALKTIKDLEMQVRSQRKTLEELQTERDVLLERVDMYMHENSSLKARLDEQRCNAGVLQRQLSADLESQIRRLEVEIEKLNDLSAQKDRQLRDLNTVLEQTTKSLKIRETEALNRSKEESTLVTTLKTDLQNSLEEQSKLEETIKKMKEKAKENVSIPTLVDSMLEEKNAEIDRLEKEVTRLSNRRAASSLIRSKSGSESVNLSKSAKRVKFSEPDSFVDMISPIMADQPSTIRAEHDSFPHLLISSQHPPKLLRYSSTPESLSSLGPLQLSPRGGDPCPNTTLRAALDISQDMNALKKELNEKTEALKKCEVERSCVDEEMREIRDQLRVTMNAVEEDKQMYKKQFEQMLKDEALLQMEVDAKRREVSEHLLEMDTLRSNLAEVNQELVKKEEELRKLKNNTSSLHITIESLQKSHAQETQELHNKLEFERNRLDSVLGELKILEDKKVEIEEEFQSLKTDYNEKLNEEQKLNWKLKLETIELRDKNVELSEKNMNMKTELENTMKDAKKLSKNLENLKKENEELRKAFVNLQQDLERLMNVEKKDSSIQTVTERRESSTQIDKEFCEVGCQTYDNMDLALVPVKKHQSCDDMNQFQDSLEKLRVEVNAWEQKMNEAELTRTEYLSFLVLVRTLLSCILDNLDDHFLELEACRRKMMECSVDDLTDRVQRELILSQSLDNRLLSTVLVEHGGGGDNCLAITNPAQNMASLTVRICELEANLQDGAERNKELEAETAELRKEGDELRRRIEQQQRFIRVLEESLAKERTKLASEKSRYGEDAKIMEVLRVNLENGFDRIEQLEVELKAERQQRIILEKQIKQIDIPPTGDNEARATSELRAQLESERHKVTALGLNVEKEKRKCQEVKTLLEQERLERMSEKDVQRLMGSDLALLQEQKENLESQLSNARELLKTRHTEIISLKRKISLQELDIKALTISNEHQQDKDSEVSMMTEKVQELQRELDFYRKQIQKSPEKLEVSIPGPLLLKMRDLNTCVEQHVQESTEMGEALLHLTQETEQMKTLIKKLEESTEKSPRRSGDDTLQAEVEAEKRWQEERDRRLLETEQLRNECDAAKLESMELIKANDALKLEMRKITRELELLKDEIACRENQNGVVAEDRVVHLFGRYMRAESYRKALAWQKRYLMVVISGYEDSEEETWAKLNRIANGRKDVKRRHVDRRKSRTLKGAAMAVVAIFRMQYLVRRWRHGRVAGVSAMLAKDDTVAGRQIHRPASTLCLSNGPIDPLAFQTHNFVRPRSQPTSNVLRTPPSRDPGLRSKTVDAKKVTECIERFKYLQMNLGLSGKPP